MAELKAVILAGAYKSNNGGELCGFPVAEADELVRRGLARFPEEEKEPKKAKPVSKAPPANKKVAKAPVEK